MGNPIIFYNDIEQIVYNLKNWNIPYEDYPILLKAKETVASFINQAEIDDSKLERLTIEYKNIYQIHYNKIVSGQENMLDFFNPIYREFLYNNEVLIPPISLNWINKDPIVKEIFEQFFTGDVEAAKGDFAGVVGNVFSYQNEYLQSTQIIIDFLLTIAFNQNVALSFEIDWIRKNIKNIEDAKSIILFGNDAWTNDINAKIASELSIDVSFGPLKALPIHVIAIHELDQGNLQTLPGDSHINADLTKEVWNALSKSEDNLKEVISEEFFKTYSYQLNGETKSYTREIDTAQIDYIYQASTFHKVIFLACFLIKNNLVK